MDPDIQKQLAEQRELLEKVLRSSESIRRYFKWGFIITVVMIVLPLIGLAFVIPVFLQNFSSLYGAVGL